MREDEHLYEKHPVPGKKRPGSDYLTFFSEYCRNLRGIGSVVPDSNICFNSLLKHVPFDSAEMILEFGAGSGTVTREIIRRKRPDTVFVSFEKNRTFYKRLSDSVRGDNVFIKRKDVFDSIAALDAELGLKQRSVDCIISTLPCSCLNFDALVRETVLPLLKDEGFFIQYMHCLSLLKGFRLKPLLMKYFGKIHSGFVFLNLPPVFIYTCRQANGNGGNGRAGVQIS